jgi:uncharacterized protein YjbI with pentapeptide repeats
MNIKGKNKISEIHKTKGITQRTVISIVMFLLSFSAIAVYCSQYLVERDAFFVEPLNGAKKSKDQYEIVKLAAEIRQIRSDTGGSLFWLKMIALFVTVGGAVGGYLVGQSATVQARIEFEDRNNVDAVFQSILQELSDEKSTLLRAAAAVKLGMLLRSFPAEWSVSETRKNQLTELTKEVLATSLSIENKPKVLKTLTSAIVMHRPLKNDMESQKNENFTYSDLKEIDLSGANGCNAYWAKVDFTNADFYQANLDRASFRSSILKGAQFREAIVTNTVFKDAKCDGANFNFADLRYANFTGATLSGAIFEGAKVYGVVLTDAKLGGNHNVMVDISPDGNGSTMVSLQDWLTTFENFKV